MQSFTALEYLMIDIANSFGLDKADWSTRIDWVREHAEDLEDFTAQAKEPAQFMAGVAALRDVLDGKPIGYLCGLDGTASGLQILSVLSGCRQSASICNVVSTGHREDAYVSVHYRMGEILGTPLPQNKAVKSALMTHLYGSKLEPQKAFGSDTPELAAFYQAVSELLPGADLLNRALINLWQPDAYSHNWTLPDGFDVVIKVEDNLKHSITFLGETHEVLEKINTPKDKGLSMGANIVHSIDGMLVREMNRRCNFNGDRTTQIYNMIRFEQGGTYTLRKNDLALLRVLELYNRTGFMSAVVLDYLDENNHGHLDNMQRYALVRLLESMPSNPFELLCIHDCFKFHPNYGNDVREQYVFLLMELADSEVLSHIASQVRGIYTPVNKLTSNLSAFIQDSEYALS